MIDVPHDLQAERKALINEIHAAFDGVSREGGVSWSETKLLDDWGESKGRAGAEARAKDTDRSWTDLTTDENWNAGVGVDGWLWLDPISMRYYLPAGMIKMITIGYDAFPSRDLTEVVEVSSDQDRERHSLLNGRQRKCVVRLIHYMIAWEDAITPPGCSSNGDDWREIRDGYWKAFG